jgi:hypothetical protein
MGCLPHSGMDESFPDTPGQFAARLPNQSLFFPGGLCQTMVNWTLLSMMPALMA